MNEPKEPSETGSAIVLGVVMLIVMVVFFGLYFAGKVA